MSAESEAIVRRWFEEGLGAGNLAVIDELLAPDYVNHNRFPGQPPGREGVIQFFARVRAGLPDVQLVFEDILSSGDRVAYRATLRGTHRGPLSGIPPTGRRVEVPVFEIARVVDGRVAERWGALDLVGLLQQLGILPPLELADTPPGRVGLWLYVHRLPVAGGLAGLTLALLVLGRLRRRRPQAADRPDDHAATRSDAGGRR